MKKLLRIVLYAVAAAALVGALGEFPPCPNGVCAVG